MSNADRQRLIEASLRVAAELERQAAQQRDAAARLLLGTPNTKENDHG